LSTAMGLPEGHPNHHEHASRTVM